MKDTSAHWTQLRGGSDLLCAPRGIGYCGCLPQSQAGTGSSELADQVAIAANVLRAFPALGHELAGRYRLVLLDEYQDTSINQAEFLGPGPCTDDDCRERG